MEPSTTLLLVLYLFTRVLRGPLGALFGALLGALLEGVLVEGAPSLG